MGDCHLNLTDMVAIRFLGSFCVYSAHHPAEPLRVLTVATEGALPEARPQEALLKHLAAQGSQQHLRILSTMDQGYAGKGEEDEPLNPLLRALDDDKVSSGHAVHCIVMYCHAWSTGCKDFCQRKKGLIRNAQKADARLPAGNSKSGIVCGTVIPRDPRWRAAVNSTVG